MAVIAVKCPDIKVTVRFKWGQNCKMERRRCK
jgi:hypothetical protein